MNTIFNLSLSPINAEVKIAMREYRLVEDTHPAYEKPLYAIESRRVGRAFWIFPRKWTRQWGIRFSSKYSKGRHTKMWFSGAEHPYRFEDFVSVDYQKNRFGDYESAQVVLELYRNYEFQKSNQWQSKVVV